MSQVLVPPQDFHANIQYRQDLRKWAVQSPKNRSWLMEKCREDFFFFCESFCWLYEPRPVEGKPKVIPFIPWDHQREPITTIIDSLGRVDIGIEKARGEGASWMCLTIIQWRWLFHVMESFGLVSMNETAADSQDDPNSLGWKLDWQLKMLPAWMSGKRTTPGKPGDYIRNITKHTWMNLRTDSTIAAYACTGDLASGGRKTAFLMDELAKFPRGPDQEAMAATEPITNCRLLISTPKGSDGAYFRCMTIPSSMIKIVLDWTKNPTRNQNMFLIEHGTNALVDVHTKKETEFLIKYAQEFYGQHSHILKLHGFALDDYSKIWSPWYVSRCIRPQMNVKMIAQEYDRDYGGSVARFFPHQLITMLLERTRPPLLQGDLVCDTNRMRVKSFTKLKYGHLKLWVNLSHAGAPPKGEYVLGIDVATGQGGAQASNSVISIVDRKRGVKVAEFASSRVRPEELVQYAVSLARWFVNEDGGPAYMIWEKNGPGESFRDIIIGDTDFRNFYYKTQAGSIHKKATKIPGWNSSKSGKRELLGRYRHALTEGLFDNPSDFALRECECYIEAPGGRLVFESALNDIDDPANSGDNHGDRVIADALTCYAMEEMNGAINITKKQEKRNPNAPMPVGSFGWRREQWQKNQREKKPW